MNILWNCNISIHRHLGKTKLAQQFPETLPLALEKHQAILKEIIESKMGIERGNRLRNILKRVLD